MSQFAVVILFASLLFLAVSTTRMAGALGLISLALAYPLIALFLLLTVGAVFHYQKGE